MNNSMRKHISSHHKTLVTHDTVPWWNDTFQESCLLYIIFWLSALFCKPVFLYSTFKYILDFCILLFMGFFPLVLNFLQPDCDPMTAPVPVPMLLISQQVRCIFTSFDCLGTAFISAARKNNAAKKRQMRKCPFSFAFCVARSFEPKSAAAGVKSREIFFLQEETMWAAERLKLCLS